GGSLRGAETVAEPTAAASDDPIAQGELVFRQTPPACFACHSTSPGVALAGPSLAGLATRAAALVDSAHYTGSATDAEGYIRESIVNPHAYLVPGAMFSSGGRSFMPDNNQETLSAEQIDQLVAYMLSLR